MYIVGYNAIRVQYTSFLLNDSTGSFLHSLDQRLKYPNGYRSPRSLDATFELINVLWIRIFINAERLNTPQVLKPKDWLPNSLNLSPIENFEVCYHSTFITILHEPKNFDQLKHRLQRAWRSIAVGTLQTLIQSMPNKVSAVIKQKGDTVR